MVMGSVRQGIMVGRRELAYTSCTGGRGRMQWRWVGGQPVVVSCKGGVGVAVGWRVGGVGRVEEVPVNGWWLGALKKKRGLKRKDGGLNR